MVFSVVDILGTEGSPDPLFPTPASEVDGVAPESGDGALLRVPVVGIWAESKTTSGTTSLGETGEVKASLYVSDRRTIVACTHFRNGGGWHGYGTAGAAVAVLANAVGNAIEHHRTKGQMLVGHVRHEWLLAVIARDRRGWGSENHLELFFKDPTTPDHFCILHTQLERRALASPVAVDVVSRAARYRAAQADEEGLRSSLLSYAANPTFSEVGKQGSRIYYLPTK